MKAVHEDLIRQRAYAIWEQSGRLHGLDRVHWEQAERELLDAAPAIKAKALVKSPTKSRGAPVGAASKDQGRVGRDTVGKPDPGRPRARGEAARVR